MQRIVFITTGLSTGGAEMMLLKLLGHLDRARFEPSVISLRDKGEIGPRIEALGIPVHALGMRPGIPALFELPTLVRLLRKIRPEVVQTWMYHADLLGGLAARLAGIESLAWGVRNSDLSAHRSKRTTLLVVRLCAALSRWAPQAILSCSERAKEIHVHAGYRADKFRVIPNGFDLGRFLPDDRARISVRDELGVASQTPLVGLIARLDPQKNHLGFVEAAASIHRALPETHFLLAGSGVDGGNAPLNAAIASHGLSSQMHLLGRRDDVPRLMAALDVLVSSSHGEAFPNVLGEAMACGVPCVATDVGDSAEIVGDTGRVVAPGDMIGLARHVVELLRQPQLREALGEQARRRVRDRYEIGAIARQYERFYLELAESV